GPGPSHRAIDLARVDKVLPKDATIRQTHEASEGARLPDAAVPGGTRGGRPHTSNRVIQCGRGLHPARLGTDDQDVALEKRRGDPATTGTGERRCRCPRTDTRVIQLGRLR